MGMRAVLETWFDTKGIHPRSPRKIRQALRADGFLCSRPGSGFTALATVVAREVLKHWSLRVIANVEECGTEFYAITAERRVKNPAAMAITEHAYSSLFA